MSIMPRFWQIRKKAVFSRWRHQSFWHFFIFWKTLAAWEVYMLHIIWMFRRVMKVPSYQISTSNHHYFGFYKQSCTAGHFAPHPVLVDLKKPSPGRVKGELTPKKLPFSIFFLDSIIFTQVISGFTYEHFFKFVTCNRLFEENSFQNQMIY